MLSITILGTLTMAGAVKDDKGEDVLRQGLMTKRSQNKKRFTPVNYKQRLFILTRKTLTYYDIDGEVSSAKYYLFHFLLIPLVRECRK